MTKKVTKKEDDKTSQTLAQSLKELEKIADWFDGQEEIDVEKGIEKIKKGTALLKDTRQKLSTIENEFEDIKKSL